MKWPTAPPPLNAASESVNWGTPTAPNLSWRPHSSDHPVWRLTLLLVVSAGLPYVVLSGLPYVVLSATYPKPLPAATAYRLYSLSNLGWLLALLSYPFLALAFLANPRARPWSAGILAYTLNCGYCASPMGEASASPKTCPGTLCDGGPARTQRMGLEKHHCPDGQPYSFTLIGLLHGFLAPSRSRFGLLASLWRQRYCRYAHP